MLNSGTVLIVVLILLSADISGLTWLISAPRGNYRYVFFLELLMTFLTLFDLVGLARTRVVPPIGEKEISRVNRFICALGLKLMMAASLLTLG